MTSSAYAAFFDAIRSNDVAVIRQLLAQSPALATACWPGRSGDGKMRSLGLRPFNQHTWHMVPADHADDDPRYTSTPLIYSRDDQIVRLLVEAKADVNAKGTSGDLETPTGSIPLSGVRPTMAEWPASNFLWNMARISTTKLPMAPIRP